jgi:hypothetical protein
MLEKTAFFCYNYLESRRRKTERKGRRKMTTERKIDLTEEAQFLVRDLHEKGINDHQIAVVVYQMLTDINFHDEAEAVAQSGLKHGYSVYPQR